ncbi:unnamed protein product [Toxocara canis]|uniref:EMI domain-containing protein n=1 Tax=Toxocara canis TaxID=6265 RepID=A0A183UHJ6_TOXCA|nr:unnamed protein product [Toxocara canis]
MNERRKYRSAKYVRCAEFVGEWCPEYKSVCMHFPCTTPTYDSISTGRRVPYTRKRVPRRLGEANESHALRRHALVRSMSISSHAFAHSAFLTFSLPLSTCFSTSNLFPFVTRRCETMQTFSYSPFDFDDPLMTSVESTERFIEPYLIDIQN